MCILFTPPVFSIFFCSRWWWPCSGVTAGQHWERKMPAVRIELLAPKTTSAAQVWAARRQQSFGRSLPHPVAKPYWRMSKDADLEAAEMKVFSLPLYNVINCFWGCSVGRLQWCVLWKDEAVLLASSGPESLWSNTVHQVQLTTSGTHLASCVEMCSQDGWLCAGPYLMRNQPVHQLNATLTSVASTFCLGPSMWMSMPCSLNLFQSQLKFTYVIPSSSPKVYREKTWLAWPAKVTQ